MFKSIKQKMKDQRGLTLIELLAVIVILGIIAAIAIPAIGNVIDNSKKKATVAEAIQIIEAARLSYSQDSTKTAWKHTAASGFAGLSGAVSKVKDESYTVNYDSATNTFSITGHEVADLFTDETTAGTMTENELAIKAR